LSLVLAVSLAPAIAVRLHAQQPDAKAAGKAAEAPGAGTRASILADYERERAQAERKRLERLARLAQSQAPAQANATYEDYFRYAIEAGLFVEAEPIAERVLAAAASSPEVMTLATVANFVAEADRGAYDDSLQSLVAAVNAAPDAAAARRPPVLSLPTRLSVLEAYYQRLIQGDQFDVVRKAMQIVAEKARDEALRAYAADRLKQLDLLGKPAPAISGRDIDNEPVSLADAKGQVVLVVFWATWCLPCGDEAEHLRQLDKAYRERGLRILGINLDAMSVPDRKPSDVVPEVKRFLVEHNVAWPNLINGTGEQDYARAYGVTSIPSSVLIGRDGTVIHLDLTRSNVEKVIARAIGE
jgi:peroxiredoxin